MKKIFSNDFKDLALSTVFGEIERFFLNLNPPDQNSTSDLPASDPNTTSDGNPTVTNFRSDLLYSVVVTCSASDGYSSSSDVLYSVVACSNPYTLCKSSLYSVVESEFSIVLKVECVYSVA